MPRKMTLHDKSTSFKRDYGESITVDPEIHTGLRVSVPIALDSRMLSSKIEDIKVYE